MVKPCPHPLRVAPRAAPFFDPHRGPRHLLLEDGAHLDNHLLFPGSELRSLNPTLACIHNFQNCFITRDQGDLSASIHVISYRPNGNTHPSAKNDENPDRSGGGKSLRWRGRNAVQLQGPRAPRILTRTCAVSFTFTLSSSTISWRLRHCLRAVARDCAPPLDRLLLDRSSVWIPFIPATDLHACDDQHNRRRETANESHCSSGRK